ncbi:MAG: phosphotransferase [Aeromicrobium sp.]
MTSANLELLDRKGEPLPLPDLAKRWPLDGWWDVQRVPGGKNDHLRVESAEGTCFLRRSYRSKTREELRFQLDHLRTLHRRGLPVPLPVLTTDGDDHVELGGRLWVLTRAIPGSPYEEQSRAHMRAFGHTVGRYHQLVSDLPAGTGEPALLGELRQRASDVAADPDVSGRAAHVVGELEALVPDLPRVVVHGGARRGSLLFEGSEVVGVLDFDSAHPDVRVLDVAVAVHDVGKVYTQKGADDHKVALDLSRVARLLEAYSDISKLTSAEQAALPLLLEAKRLKRALGRLQRRQDGEPLSDNDHAKIAQEHRRLRWLADHRDDLTAACTMAG